MTAVLKRIAASALFALLALSSPSLAQDQAVDPERTTAAKELLATMKVEEQFRKTLNNMQTVLGAQMRAQPGGDKAMTLIAKIFEPDSETVKTYLVEAEAALAKFYAERFTAPELKEITTFYASPTGQKMQSVSPESIQALGPPLAKFQEGVKTVLMQELTAKPNP